jgi:hypothetical protein
MGWEKKFALIKIPKMEKDGRLIKHNTFFGVNPLF